MGQRLSGFNHISYNTQQVIIRIPFLGPHLFFRSLEYVILTHPLNVMVYVDGAQLCKSIDSYEDRPDALAKLERLYQSHLVFANGLACNPEKTKIIHFSLSRFFSSSSYYS